jgi:hypothetical protein
MNILHPVRLEDFQIFIDLNDLIPFGCDSDMHEYEEFPKHKGE